MLFLVGVNHRSAPVALRERLAFPDDLLGAALGRLRAREAIEEALILSTCNRVEILAAGSEGARTLAEARAFLAAASGLTAEELDRCGYRLESLDVVRHLLQVACGFDSMVLGEPQILGQVRRAYAAACETGATGPLLRRLMPQVLAAARRIRHETGISRHALSVGHAAVTLARRIVGDLGGRSVLLLGAGKVGELAARHLAASGATDLTIASRTYAHSLALAARIGGRAVPWEQVLSVLRGADVVVTGTTAPHPVLRRGDVEEAMRGRRDRPLFFMDVAVPRDVEESAKDLEGVHLYDMDALEGVVETQLGERRRAAERGHRMIEAEVAAFGRHWQNREVVPTIVALRRRLHEVGRKELERVRRKLGPLSADQEQAVRELAYGIIQKVLHAPIRRLRRSSADGGSREIARLYREIFDLAGAEGAEVGPAEVAVPGELPRAVTREGRSG